MFVKCTNCIKALALTACCLLLFCRVGALASLSSQSTFSTSSTTTTISTRRGTNVCTFQQQQQRYNKRLYQKPSSTRLTTTIDPTVSDEVPRGGASSSSSSSSNSGDYIDANVINDSIDGAPLKPHNPMLNLPTLKQYRKFALPCLGLWVAGPLLSLVDTAFVGLSSKAGQSSAQQLAALGPATTFFDGATYLFAFLNVATTNLYSSARAQANDQNSPQSEAVVRTASQVALNCGIGLMIFLITCCRPLLKLYIGNKAASSPGLLDSATDYVIIRALSMPTSLLLGVVQSSLLGAKDSVTPLIAIVYSTIINVIGDYILVSRLQMGLRGAAIATTLAQWASTIALLHAARKKLVNNHSLGLWRKKEQVQGVNSRTFLAFAAPVLTLILGKLAAFGFMTHSAAAVPGQPTPLAAHQITLSLLFFCSPFLEVISQTAQTFLPAFVTPVQERQAKLQAASAKSKDIQPYDAQIDRAIQPWLQAAHSVSTTLLKLGMISAFVVASLASLIPAYFGNFLTSDKTVQQAVKPLAKYLWMGAFFWAPVAVSEGVLLARRELTFLAGVYLISTILLPPALLKIKLSGTGTVSQVWACFAVFQLFRAVCFTTRIWGGRMMQQISSRRKQAAAAAATSATNGSTA